MDKNYREELIGLADMHEHITGKTPEYIANLIVKDARFFERIGNGGGCTCDTYLKIKNWFRDNTPKSKPRTKPESRCSQ